MRKSLLKLKIRPLVLVIFSLFSKVMAGAQPVTHAKVEDPYVTEKIQTLSLTQKVGQLFILGFKGQSHSSGLSHKLKTMQPGAVIVFKKNISSLEQIKSLNESAQKMSQKLSGVPLFIMLDQEGGSVSRINLKPPFPSALSLGMSHGNLVEEYAANSGKILKSLGFNFNLAPVVDLSDPYLPSFVANRSLGGDPKLVSEITEAYSKGLIQSGVIPTLKHFPGHGSTLQDSHKGLAVKKSDIEQLMNYDLTPYIHMANAKLPVALMVAHISLPNIDSSGLPATFSKKIISELLVDKLHFEGLIITDDLEMIAASKIANVEERAITAINAGCDMIMMTGSAAIQERVFLGLLKAVKKNRITLERLNQSVSKILKYKMQFGLTPEVEPPFQELTYMHTEITNKITKDNLRVSLKSNLKLKNYFNANQKFKVFTADGSFAKQFSRVSKADLVYLSKKGRLKNKVFSLLDNTVGIFYITGVGTARILNALPQKIKEQLIVVNATYPAAVSNYKDHLAVINVNTNNPLTGYWIANFLINTKQDRVISSED